MGYDGALTMCKNVVYWCMRGQGPRSLGILPVVGSLVVVALLIVVALQIYGGGKHGDGQTVTEPIERAAIIQCKTQIRNLATMIGMYSAENGRYPAGLRDLENVTDEMLYCPVTRRPYSYDPTSGKVWCPDHP
jgi:hypothetical protein